MELNLLAIGIVTGQKYIHDRVSALRDTWLSLVSDYVIFGDKDIPELNVRKCCPRNQYVGVGPSQQKWKYILPLLISAFPNALFYLNR
eukprot:UN13173